jgi:hypothetical protein
MSTAVVALSMFAALLALLVALRAKTGNKIDIRNSDIVLALVPVALWLFLTGKIQEFGFGEVKIVAAIKMAATAPVGPEVSKLTIEAVSEPVRMMSKGAPDVIPQMINTKSQALSFMIGQGGYAGPAVADYLDQLTQYPFLRYIVLNNPDGTFYGIADARQIEDISRAPRHRRSSRRCPRRGPRCAVMWPMSAAARHAAGFRSSPSSARPASRSSPRSGAWRVRGVRPNGRIRE